VVRLDHLDLKTIELGRRIRLFETRRKNHAHPMRMVSQEATNAG